jgi:hypothetical protein
MNVRQFRRGRRAAQETPIRADFCPPIDLSDWGSARAGVAMFPRCELGGPTERLRVARRRPHGQRRSRANSARPRSRWEMNPPDQAWVRNHRPSQIAQIVTSHLIPGERGWVCAGGGGWPVSWLPTRPPTARATRQSRKGRKNRTSRLASPTGDTDVDRVGGPGASARTRPQTRGALSPAKA